MATRRDYSGEKDPGQRTFWDQASHDLRQPIQSLQLLSQLFARHAESDSLRQAADHMRRALADLTRMQDDLIRLLRLEEGRSTAEDRDTDVSRLLCEILRELTDSLPDGKVDVRTDRVAAEPKADPEWLPIILRGMILLAANHSKDAPISVEAESREDTVSVTVNFEGQEIRAHEASSLFLEASGPGEARAFLGPRYLSRACELLGYRLDLGEEGQGRQSIRLSIPSSRRSHR